MPTPSRRAPGAVTALAIALAFAGCDGAKPRNVVLVVLDDLGVDRVGAYDTGLAGPTPRLDALAHEGVRFTRFWGMPNCSPFRAAVLTGLPVRGHHVGAVAHPAHCLVDRVIAHVLQMRLLSGKHLLETARVAVQLA